MKWRGLPLPALTLFIIAALMLGPALLGAVDGDWKSARIFAQSAGLIVAIAGALCFAHQDVERARRSRAEILTVVFVFAVAPAFAAVPLYLRQPVLGLGGAYFDMVASFTTTGASVDDDIRNAPRALMLWRALGSWFGGFAALLAAAAVFAPRNLGGFEVQVDERVGSVGRLSGAPGWAVERERAQSGDRLTSALTAVAPAYFGLTGALAIAFASLGVPGMAAVVQAMGVMSTSAVTIDGRGFQGGVLLEAIAVAFLAMAATRHAFAGGSVRARMRKLKGDPEIELALIATGLATLWMFARHWFASLEISGESDALLALDAAWGALFTAISFLTTTGYVSESWHAARAWSGLPNPGMLLLGLAAMGGGVASTAGGVKLLRSFALYQNGLREVNRLAHPREVARRGSDGRRVGFAGATLAWVFVMLFLLSVGVATLGLAATGVRFERALAAAIAALSNAGPAYAMALGPEAPGFSALDLPARLILCGAMVLGRVEILAVIALANPAHWRR